MKRVFLLRHGETEASAAHVYYGSTDVPLSENGIAELEKRKISCQYPKKEGLSFCTSGMLRTEQTLQILYPGVSHMTEPDFREMDFGAFEMHGYEELKDRDDYQRWISGDFVRNVCPGGESSEHHLQRVRCAFRSLLASEEEDVLLIAHAGSIVAIMSMLFPEEGETRWYWNCAPGTGFCVSFSGQDPIGWKRVPDGDRFSAD